MNFIYLKRIGFSLLLLLLSMLLLYFSIKTYIALILGIAGFLIFSLNFKKLIIPILFLAFVLFPISISQIHYIYPFYSYIIPGFSFSKNFSTTLKNPKLYTHTEKPTKEISYAAKIKIDSPGVWVTFDPETENIKIPKDMEEKRIQDSVYLSYPGIKHSFFNRRRSAKIIVGVKDKGIEKLKIDSMGAFIDGYIKVKEIKLNGMGIKISGKLETEKLSADGMGIDMDINVIHAPYIKMNGMGIRAHIKYTKPWNEEWILDIEGIGTNVNYTIPGNNPGRLIIKKNSLGGVIHKNEY